jgi:PAS domain S-box-containing protein
MNSPPNPFNNLQALIHRVGAGEQSKSMHTYGQCRDGEIVRDISEARKQEEHLRTVLAELKTILDNTLAGIILVQDDHIVRVNTTAEKMFGYTASEITEFNWIAFQPLIFTGKETACPAAKEQMFSLQKKNQQLFWAKVRQVSFPTDAKCESVLYLFEDVSQQKKMFEKIQQLGQAVDQSSNSIVITNTSGKIEYVNKTFVKTTGYSSQEAIGLTPAILNAGKTPESVYRDMWLTITSGREWTGEFINKKKNGELYEEYVVVSPLRNEDGEITHFVATKDNITDLKKARLQAELASQAKSDFLANMSHEIRTPMNAIIGMSELLLDTELAPEQRRYLNSVNNSAEHLLTLINDILDYSKIEAKQLVLETIPFKPHMLIEEIVTTLSLQAEQKQLQLTSLVAGDGESDCFLLGDPLRLKQVLLNITGNALKFTDTGTVTLELAIRLLDTDSSAPNSVTFTVRDTGIGISPQQQEAIFDNFSQSDSSVTRKFGGTGLGLAISKRLVQLMGGSIKVESSPGNGSTFSFTLLLPRALKQEQLVVAVPDEQPLLSAGRSLSVLLVEDNPANQELARILLENQGHDVRIAKHGLDALLYLSEEEYDLVFMDIQMPVLDGLTTTRYIRNFEQGIIEAMPECASLAERLTLRLANRHTHIVAVTANAMEEDRLCCLDAGMDHYLSKPYKKRSFHEVLENFVGATRQDHSSEQNISPLPDKKAARAMVSVGTVRGHLMENYGLKSTEADSILDTYAESLGENLQRLQKAVGNQDGEEAGCRAHALKGAFLNIGQPQLADTAHLLEKELPEKIETRHVTRVEQLIEALQPITDRKSIVKMDMKS